MKIAVASDHGGMPLKPILVEQLESLGHEVIDLGAHQLDIHDDYPDYARYVGQAIQHGQADRGIVQSDSGCRPMDGRGLPHDGRALRASK